MYRLAGLEISGRRFRHFASTFFSTVFVKPLFCYYHEFLAVIAVVSSNIQSFAAGWSEAAFIRSAPGQLCQCRALLERDSSL